MTRFSRSGARRARASAAFRFCSSQAVEPLEARVLLSAYVVTNTSDSGPGSLRQAILDANASTAANTVAFDILGAGVQTIAPTSPLPAILGHVTIDGTTQPGYSAVAGAPVIELSGAHAGAGASGLVVGTSGSTFNDAITVKALIINGFSNEGIILQGRNEQVKGCYIGLNAVGDAASPNGLDGIEILGASATIGGPTTAERNVISGNGLNGIVDRGAGASIVGNYIGTNAIGSAAVGNGQAGIEVLGAATIGGAGPLGNVIAGNGSSGIFLKTGNVVQIAGNRIGTDASGAAAVGNGASPAAEYRDGITAVGDGAVPIGRLSIGVPAADATPAIGNLISGNHGNGVSLVGSGADGNLQIVANLVGTDASGNLAVGNAGNGLVLDVAFGNGFSVSGNVFSGNGADGILVQAPSGAISGNNIGTNQAGTAAIPNAANGVEIESFAQLGSQTGPGNLISGNGENGILVRGQYGSVWHATITNNLIGTDFTANLALGNHLNGILVIDSNQNTIQSVGTSRQVISGNGAAGISIQGGGGNTITGNNIGTNLAGDAPLGNGGNGVELFDFSNTVTQNLISANRGSGVYIGEFPDLTASTTGTQVSGNKVGTNAEGDAVAGMGNAGDGVTIFRSSYNVVGKGGNIIAGNGGNGVTITSGGIFLPDNNADADPQRRLAKLDLRQRQAGHRSRQRWGDTQFVNLLRQLSGHPCGHGVPQLHAGPLSTRATRGGRDAGVFRKRRRRSQRIWPRPAFRCQHFDNWKCAGVCDSLAGTAGGHGAYGHVDPRRQSHRRRVQYQRVREGRDGHRPAAEGCQCGVQPAEQHARLHLQQGRVGKPLSFFCSRAQPDHRKRRGGHGRDV